MATLNELKESELNKIRLACSYLFTAQHAKDDEFIKSLNISSVKDAFRKKAKLYHPDLYYNESQEVICRRKERFVKVQYAYRLLSYHLQERTEPLVEQGTRRAKIIAVSGAKGGIGKSIFTTNLAVFLSGRGKKTVAVDLDLGGANLHLYLGETFLKYNINDFLSKKITTLQQIMVQSKYGPLLIGGDSSQLGSSNINFSQKLKLLKAIQKIDADYIILDLGAGTSYNMIDFFLIADHGIVLTTCDPASYLDAYNFIKASLFRRLNRLFGVESPYRKSRDAGLEELIKEATISPNGSKVKTIDKLIERVKEKYPESLSLVRKQVSTFNPHLIVNQATDHCNVTQVVNRLRDVSKKMLSIRIEYLGRVPYQSEIENSARSLVPAIKTHPQGILAENMNNIAGTLLNTNFRHYR